MYTLKDLTRGLSTRVRHAAGWRCREPVVVFESDDWGLERRPSAACLSKFGAPSEWADEASETPDDLGALYDVLERHRDCQGRPACLTANVVLSNPDFDRIERDHFASYYELPISEQGDLLAKWREGNERRVFFTQHHAQRHFWPARWLSDLRDNVPGARDMLQRRLPGGLALMKGQNWRYHSEYFNWHQPGETDAARLSQRCSTSLGHFQTVFGRPSASTIAPHYIFGRAVEAGWCAAGVTIVQSAGNRLVQDSAGQRTNIKHVMGERSPHGLLYLERTVKFDPRPQRPNHGTPQALERIRNCAAAGVPAVVDTHRINFTSAWRDQSLAALDELLAALSGHRFLTTVELGEAILNAGAYHDSLTGEARQLTPIDPIWQRNLRRVVAKVNAHRLQTYSLN